MTGQLTRNHFITWNTKVYVIYTLFKVISKTKIFHWVSGELALTSSKPIPLLLAGTQTCFCIQDDLSWQSHPMQQLDDPLDPDLDLLNLVSVRLCWTWHTSPVKQHPTLQCVCFIWRSRATWALPTQSGAGKKLIQDRIVLRWRTDSCITMAPVWEDSCWHALCHDFYLLRLSVIHIPERHSDLASLGVKAQDFSDGVHWRVPCSSWKGNKQALGCSERKWGPDPGQEVSLPVLQTSTFCLSLLFSSSHQQVEDKLLISCLPSCLPSRARGVGPTNGKAAAGTVWVHVLIPCVMLSDSLPQPGLGVVAEGIS